MDCPNCFSALTSQDINIHTDVGQCPACGHVFKVSEHVVSSTTVQEIDLHDPPGGVTVEKDMSRILITASTRSFFALFIVPFTLVWSGFSLGGIYGEQVQNGFDPFMSVFGLPFLLGSIVLIGTCLMMIGGKVTIRLDAVGGKIFTGFAGIGRTTSFLWTDVTTIKEHLSYGSKGKTNKMLALEGKTRIKFGSLLSDERMYFVMHAIQAELAKRRRYR